MHDLSAFVHCAMVIKRGMSCDDSEEVSFASPNVAQQQTLDLGLSLMRRSRLNKAASSSSAVQGFSSIGEEERS